MVIFDSPTRETCIVRENRTNTPLQALDLMNDVVYLEAARKLAERMMNEGGAAGGPRIDLGFELVLARPAETGASSALWRRALTSFERYYARAPEGRR